MKRINSQSNRRKRTGYIFIMPWMVGLVLFFIQPLISMIVYSFTNFVFVDGGYELKALEQGVFSHYIHALTRDSSFPQLLVKAISELIYQVPVVVFFSLFTAIILSKEFRGRMVMRTIFFLPIIITSGVMLDMIKKDVTSWAPTLTGKSENIFDVSAIAQMLLDGGVPSGVTTFLTSSVANVADLVWSSGIQILIFLAALLAVPAAYYEVAQVEGASGWETFWKVTFPIISPFVLVNFVYTIIDSFTSFSNGVMKHIVNYFNLDMKYSYASAMSWLYFIMIILVLVVVFLLFRRRVFYGNK